MSRARNWCFTLNFSEVAPPFVPQAVDFPEWVSYVCFQEEVGAEGTHHLQGYLECVGVRSLQQLLSLPAFDGLQDEGYSLRFQVRKGTQSQAIAYCRKVDETTVPNSFVEYGEVKEQGKRSDLLDIKRKVDDGAALVDIWDAHYGSMLRYHRSVKEYKRIKTPKRNWTPFILVIWGPSGAGKSRLARQLYPDAYWKPNNKWWDDYDNQSAVIWDEFKGQYPFRDLLRVLDSTPLTLETKGASCQFIADTVVFTSNFHPSDWYDPQSVGHSWEDSPLRRRLAEFAEFIYLDRRYDVPGPAVAEQGRSALPQLPLPHAPDYWYDPVAHPVIPLADLFGEN